MYITLTPTQTNVETIMTRKLHFNQQKGFQNWLGRIYVRNKKRSFILSDKLYVMRFTRNLPAYTITTQSFTNSKTAYQTIL